METCGSDLAGRRVLVIEDEALIAMLLEDQLGELGCAVAAVATRFEDAMEKATSLAFDVAILDVNLRGKESFPIAEALRARRLPFVFATGYGATALPEPLRSVPIVHKPYQLQQLAGALGAAIEAKA